MLKIKTDLRRSMAVYGKIKSLYPYNMIRFNHILFPTPGLSSPAKWITYLNMQL